MRPHSIEPPSNPPTTTPTNRHHSRHHHPLPILDFFPLHDDRRQSNLCNLSRHGKYRGGSTYIPRDQQVVTRSYISTQQVPSAPVFCTTFRPEEYGTASGLVSFLSCDARERLCILVRWLRMLKKSMLLRGGSAFAHGWFRKRRNTLF